MLNKQKPLFPSLLSLLTTVERKRQTGKGAWCPVANSKGFLFSSNIVDFVQQKSVTCKQQMDIDDKKKSPTSLVLSRKTTKNEII